MADTAGTAGQAARAPGRDTGPMSGFDNAEADGAFLAVTAVKSNFPCRRGDGDPAARFPRNPRFAFAEMCDIV